METAAKASNPTPHTVPDSFNPEEKFATDVVRMIKSRCCNPEGILDPDKLRSLLDRVVTLVKKETGVIPSAVTTPAISDPPNDNPRDPDEWNWAEWAKCHRLERGMGDMKLSKQMKICSILGANVGREFDKINSLLQHELHRDKEPKHLDDLVVKLIIQSKSSCSEIFCELFNRFSNCYNPTGMIMAAIKLGYLPREDILKLYNLSL